MATVRKFEVIADILYVDELVRMSFSKEKKIISVSITYSLTCLLYSQRANYKVSTSKETKKQTHTNKDKKGHAYHFNDDDDIDDDDDDNNNNILTIARNQNSTRSEFNFLTTMQEFSMLAPELN
jgi:hypothetical protein